MLTRDRASGEHDQARNSARPHGPGWVGILTDNQYFDLVNGHTKYPQDVVGSGLDMFAGVAARGNVLHERVQCVGYRFRMEYHDAWISGQAEKVMRLA